MNTRHGAAFAGEHALGDPADGSSLPLAALKTPAGWSQQVWASQIVSATPGGRTPHAPTHNLPRSLDIDASAVLVWASQGHARPARLRRKSPTSGARQARVVHQVRVLFYLACSLSRFSRSSPGKPTSLSPAAASCALHPRRRAARPHRAPASSSRSLSSQARNSGHPLIFDSCSERPAFASLVRQWTRGR